MAEPAPTTEPGALPEEERQRTWEIGVGLGATEFTGDTADDATDLGTTYELRVGYRATPMLGLEVAYIGTSQSINALGLDPDADLDSDGLEALAKVDFERYAAADLGRLRISPFVFGGLAFQRFSLSDEGTNTANVTSEDNVLAVPLGVGVGGVWGRALVDTRLAWRRTFDEDLFRLPDGTNAESSLSQWTLGARVGVTF